MLLFDKYKKPLIIIFSILVSIVAIILILQLVIGSILQGKLEDTLSNRDNSRYNLSIEKVKVNLFTMTLIFKDVSIIPDSTLLNQVKSKKSQQDIALSIHIPDIRIKDIGLISFLNDKHVNVGNFIINKASIVIINSKKNTTPDKTKTDDSPGIFSLDSIVVPGVNGISIGKFTYKNFSTYVIDAIKNDTTFHAESLDITIDKVALIKNENDSISFRLVVDDANVHMKNEKFYLPGGKYILSFGDMIFNKQDEHIVFNNLKIKPLYNLHRMAAMSKYQYGIIDLEIRKTEVHSFNLGNILRDSKIFLSNVEINQMNIKLYKDQTRPFDKEKRPMLPQQLLKSIQPGIYVDSLLIVDSELTFTAKREEKKEPMVVSLGNLNVKISNITSVLDSIVDGEVLTVNLSAKLQKKIPMGVNMQLPLNSIADTFSFDGWLNGGNMKLFDPILLPVLGIKFNEGYLDGITFSASANSVYSIGEMTMLYHDINAEVVKNQSEERNKFLSWAAKQVVKANNPAKDKEKRTVPMYFERVVYKGPVNFLWRTLQSGIVATLIPTMDTKVQNEIYSAKGLNKKQMKKESREKARKVKKNKRNRK